MADGGPSPLDDGDRRRRDHVRLGLPSGGPAAALARAAMVTLGRQAGFGRSLLGALTLAVDEALVLVLPTTNDGVDLDVAVGAGTLSVVVAARQPHAPLDPSAVTRFDDVVADLVTSVAVERATGVVGLEVVANPDRTGGNAHREP